MILIKQEEKENNGKQIISWAGVLMSIRSSMLICRDYKIALCLVRTTSKTGNTLAILSITILVVSLIPAQLSAV